MAKNTMMHTQRVTRYNLTIAFEELYTQDAAQLHTSADAIGEVARAIEQLITTDTALQELLKTHNLKLSMISPVRMSRR
jgi:hypothetical protein